MKANKTKNRNRDCNELAAEVVKFDLAKVEDLGALEMHIRSTWSVIEIVNFQHSLHGGDFISTAGWKRERKSGIVASTEREDYALTQLWERLLADCWRMVGAASVLHVSGIKGAKLFKWSPARKTAKHKKIAMKTNVVNIFGEDDALIFKTYNELTQLIGNHLERQTTRQAKVASSAPTGK